MKSATLFLSLLIFAYISANAQVYTISGNAFLQFKTDHRNISVIFKRVAPTVAKDTIFTDSTGAYNASLEMGIYQLIFEKQNFASDTLNDVKLLADVTLADVTLISIGLTGNLSGVLPKGDYIVGDNISVIDGDTLILEPGVKLLFKKNKTLSVKGIMYAIGTEKDSIIFTRILDLGDNPDTTFWKGIKLTCNNSAWRQETSILKYCHISYCNDHAIYVELASPTLQNILVSEFVGYGAIETFSCKSKISNIKFNNIKGIDTNNTQNLYSCLYLVETSIANIENIEIAGIKSKNLAALGFFNCSEINFTNLFIHDNAGPVSNAFFNKSSVKINNSTIINNSGGITDGSSMNFTNCIFANNSKFGFGGSRVASSDIYNNAVWDAQDKWVGVNVMKNKRGDSCDIYGNITLDPQFKDYVNHDYTLSPISPCIDVGVNDSVGVNKDFLGNIRIWDGNMDGDSTVDMGAFEFGAIPGMAKRPIDEDFEYGFLSWKATDNTNDQAPVWTIRKTQLAHSGQYCAYLPGSSDLNSSLITDEFYLQEKDTTILSFWLSENIVNKINKENDKPFYSGSNVFTVNLRYYEKGKPVKIELLNLTNIKANWTKYTTDISKYAGKTVAIEFSGIINETPGLLLDDVLVATPDNSTGVDDESMINPERSPITISPNPVSKFAKISYNLQSPSKVRLSLFDALGQEVMLIDEGNKEAGNISTNFAIRPEMQSGLYFLRLQSGKDIQTRKIVVVK